MKTRLLVVLFCLVWTLGCGNRDPDDVETGFGRFETASVRICNDRNCFGGLFDDMPCVDDLDCGAGGPDDPQCEIFVPFNECSGGSALPSTPCETVLDCGSACDTGLLEGAACSVDSDCKACVGGTSPDGTQCDTPVDCGGRCMGGVFPDGAPCETAVGCGIHCVGGTNDGSQCLNDNFCPGGFCGVTGDECVFAAECVQSGDCIPGECNQVGEGCANAGVRLDFSGDWQSCLNQDTFISGRTNLAEPGRLDGPPVEIEVSGCNGAVLDVTFENAGVASPGCVSVEFTSADRPVVEQCADVVHLEIDF